MLVVNIKTEYKADFSDWKMLAERFEVKKHQHFVEGSADAEIIPPLMPREGEELIMFEQLVQQVRRSNNIFSTLGRT